MNLVQQVIDLVQKIIEFLLVTLSLRLLSNRYEPFKKPNIRTGIDFTTLISFSLAKKSTEHAFSRPPYLPLHKLVLVEIRRAAHNFFDIFQLLRKVFTIMLLVCLVMNPVPAYRLIKCVRGLVGLNINVKTGVKCILRFDDDFQEAFTTLGFKFFLRNLLLFLF